VQTGPSIRIEVFGEESISAQARTYAEYRVFAALAPFAEKVRSARVELRRIDRDRPCENVACAVTVVLDRSGLVRIRATGAHAYAAINLAVERLGTATARRVAQSLNVFK